MTATELAEQLDQGSQRESALQKGQLEEKSGRREAKLILRKLGHLQRTKKENLIKDGREILQMNFTVLQCLLQ